ncbi:hypothetical protein VNO80_32931 [Phaseolus coccineus]|uniref:Uncharacterized protein n=1 Tax=Phaseolus coccineus TaxID=3886 RepID=A0AAN9L255_PHACN
MLLGSERKLVMLSATGLSPSRVQHSLLLRLAARHLYSSPTTPFSRFRLLPFRSPLLRESLLLSFPLATKMFQFTRLSLACPWIQQQFESHAPPVSAFPKAPLSFKRIRGMSSPGGILNALATALHGSIRTAPSIHRLRLGLLGYLIPFAPLAFVSQCQCRPSRVLSPLVFFPISTHFTAPPEIPSAPTVLQLGSFHRLSRVEPWDLTANLKSHLQTLYAQSFRITLASSVLPRLLAQS